MHPMSFERIDDDRKPPACSREFQMSGQTRSYIGTRTEASKNEAFEERYEHRSTKSELSRCLTSRPFESPYEPNISPIDSHSLQRSWERVTGNDNQLSDDDQVMMVALSSFQDLSPCESSSWVSTDEEIRLDSVQAVWDLGIDVLAWNTSDDNCIGDANINIHFSTSDRSTSPSINFRPLSTRTHSSDEWSLASRTSCQRSRSSMKYSPNKSNSNIHALSTSDFIEDEPSIHDVFLGRGGKSNTHCGNARWLEEKAKLQQKYVLATKGTKKVISQLLVDRIHERGGRFLQPVKFQDKPPVYRYIHVVDNDVLIKKASQTLRETNAEDFFNL